MTRLSREISGELVMDALSHSDPTIDEACEELDITPGQFHYGLGYVRDILAGAGITPVVYDARTKRYSLALRIEEVKVYERLRLTVMRTQMRRLLTGTAQPAAAKFGSPTSRRLVRHLTGAIEELELLLEEVALTHAAK